MGLCWKNLLAKTVDYYVIRVTIVIVRKHGQGPDYENENI